MIVSSLLLLLRTVCSTQHNYPFRPIIIHYPVDLHGNPLYLFLPPDDTLLDAEEIEECNNQTPVFDYSYMRNKMGEEKRSEEDEVNLICNNQFFFDFKSAVALILQNFDTFQDLFKGLDLLRKTGKSNLVDNLINIMYDWYSLFRILEIKEIMETCPNTAWDYPGQYYFKFRKYLSYRGIDVSNIKHNEIENVICSTSELFRKNKTELAPIISCLQGKVIKILKEVFSGLNLDNLIPYYALNNVMYDLIVSFHYNLISIFKEDESYKENAEKVLFFKTHQFLIDAFSSNAFWRLTSEADHLNSKEEYLLYHSAINTVCSFIFGLLQLLDAKTAESKYSSDFFKFINDEMVLSTYTLYTDPFDGNKKHLSDILDGCLKRLAEDLKQAKKNSLCREQPQKYICNNEYHLLSEAFLKSLFYIVRLTVFKAIFALKQENYYTGN